MKISESKLKQLLHVENKVIILPTSPQRLAHFSDIKYEKRKRKKLFTKKEVEEIFLTNCKLTSYNTNHDKIGVYDDSFVCHFINNYDIMSCRLSFKNIKKQLDKFGFEIIKKEQ
ncbi:MAG: hypothetical protein WDA02_07515 [Saccharofermentanales bacterium]